MTDLRTLVTGFGLFGPIEENPSARIVEELARQGAPGHELTTRVLPVSFERAGREIGALLREGGFDLTLLLGVAGRARKIRIERFARNRDDARIPDCEGAQPREAVIEVGAPKRYRTPFDVERHVSGLRAAGIPARVSISAGAYVCNHTYFAALHTLVAHNLPTRCLFVHVPPHEAATPGRRGGMALSRQVEAIQWLLQALRDQ